MKVWTHEFSCVCYKQFILQQSSTSFIRSEWRRPSHRLLDSPVQGGRGCLALDSKVFARRLLHRVSQSPSPRKQGLNPLDLCGKNGSAAAAAVLWLSPRCKVQCSCLHLLLGADVLCVPADPYGGLGISKPTPKSARSTSARAKR